MNALRGSDRAGWREPLSAYVPDLPGCVATGDTVEVVEENIREAIRLHIPGLREDHLPVPEPRAIADYVDA